MGILREILLPARRDVPEFLDAPLIDDQDISMDELDANLRQMRRLDEAFGGFRMLLDGVRQVWAPSDRISVLDVGTGAAAVPLALLEWAEAQHVQAEIVGVDLSAKILSVGARFVADKPIELVVGDMRTLPFADNSFDLAVTTLTMHHSTPEDAVKLLREMSRVSRQGFVVVDLVRSRLLQIGLWALTRLQPANRLTHHDGPVSALRAYTPEEAEDLLRQAGLHGQIHARLFRMAIVCRNNG